ncbi:glycosyl hydrolase family 65 protein [Rarobacter faecitabidus]|uniref:Alpha,alpha-trehalose phosphorylase n=1 Tax=Rarobacter faecitabidus TaxID=13243 RepID=A0A542ZAP1_RARFA|nr:glycosyl hydrolase family 65 protein [Rarobacter faecitabidus]TQL57385.1 alpha,alpha-trehalose phosphorylase [Rarobacter faecitabidus]
MSHGTAPSADPLDRSRFPADPWALRETRYSGHDLGQMETLFAVGNGYLGLRGNLEEGRDSFAHGTFINGFHETWPIRHAEEAYGFARVGQTIINAPDAKVIRIYVDDEPLLLSVADLHEYERSLDFRSGVLTRSLVWQTPSGRRVRITSTRMVSFTERHLAVMTYEVTVLDGDEVPLSISCQILNRQDGQDEYHVPGAAMGEGFDPRKSETLAGRVLQPEESWEKDGRIALGYRATSSGMTIGVMAAHEIETENSYEVFASADADLCKRVYRVHARAGVPIKVTKLVSYHTSRGVPARELIDRCELTLDRASKRGADAEFARQRAWLDDFWARSDVEITGQPELQQAVRWNLFQLAQATARAEGNGIPAKGVTGSGYSGHYFWDTEIYVLPFLTYTSPLFARNALRFRYTMLPAARARAVELNQDGALFPWRTINGLEASAYYAAGTAQYHIDADIAHAVRQYVNATGDEDFLAREGIDLLVETARLWADLGFWRENGDDTFHIHGVTGPDEYTTVVNDNMFTNVMARANLRGALRAIELLRRDHPDGLAAAIGRLGITEDELSEWHRAAEHMAIPYDSRLGIHPQDAQFLEKELWDLPNTPPDKRPLLLHFHPLVIYRFQVLKQADVVLALFLQGDEFSLAQKLADFDYYDPLTTGDSTLSAVVQSIVASEVGYQELALDYFRLAAYVDLADLHHNASDGVHVASIGGVWNALVCGFGGFRDYLGNFSLEPRLPEVWEGLTFRVTLKGTRVRVELTAGQAVLTVEDGEHATLTVCGDEVRVEAGSPITVSLPEAPRLIGSPEVRDIEGSRRADGTRMVASVPTTPTVVVPEPEVDPYSI